VRVLRGSTVIDSMLSDGCVVEPGAVVERSVLAPGVHVKKNAVVRESVILTGSQVEEGAVVVRSIIDKGVRIGEGAHMGGVSEGELLIAMAGKKSVIPAGFTIEPGAVIGTDVHEDDYDSSLVRGDDYIQTKRLAYEV
jgi:glucose-1-phosphate adenylyltransferase